MKGQSSDLTEVLKTDIIVLGSVVRWFDSTTTYPVCGFGRYTRKVRKRQVTIMLSRGIKLLGKEVANSLLSVSMV